MLYLCLCLSKFENLRWLIDALAPAKTAGGNDVVKINPAAWLLIASIKFALPAMYPPKTPNPFPKVPETITLSSSMPKSSATPAPVGPYKPTA